MKIITVFLGMVLTLIHDANSQTITIISNTNSTCVVVNYSVNNSLGGASQTSQTRLGSYNYTWGTQQPATYQQPVQVPWSYSPANENILWDRVPNGYQQSHQQGWYQTSLPASGYNYTWGTQQPATYQQPVQVPWSYNQAPETTLWEREPAMYQSNNTIRGSGYLNVVDAVSQTLDVLGKGIDLFQQIRDLRRSPR